MKTVGYAIVGTGIFWGRIGKDYEGTGGSQACGSLGSRKMVRP